MTYSTRWENFIMDDLSITLEVVNWPRPLRRAFILALPISVPLYMVWTMLFISALIVGFIVACLIDAWK